LEGEPQSGVRLVVVRTLEKRSVRAGIVVVSLFAALLLILSVVNYGQQHAHALARTQEISGVPGTLEIGILEPASSSNTLNIYQVKPAEGSIALATTRRLGAADPVDAQGIPNGGHISTCSRDAAFRVESPNRQYAAMCRQELMGTRNTNSVLIVDANSGVAVKTVPIEDFSSVRGIAWSPDSNAVSVLKESGRMGYGPTELVHALSGHPVHYSTVGFVTVTINGNQGQGLPYVGREFYNAWCFIRWRP
jgi:hypothetical protein